MALWEYKIIGSGKGGFGSPSLLESHLNQLGKDEWEIIAFNTNPENPLAFQGLARRTTQRDWTLQDAATAAAKAEAEKLRAEFAAKFQAAQAPAPDEKPASLVGEAAAPEDGLRRLRDTDRDQDPEALADGEDADDLPLDAEDELPTFFEYIRPHMRRNQRGPGLSLAVDYLANKIDQTPSDIVAALKECGFVIPEREDDDPVYLEYDGDLFWVNSNRHHQLFINTKEKPRPVFRAVKGQPFAPPETTDESTPRDETREGREGRRRKGDEAKLREPSVPKPPEAGGATALPADGSDENRAQGESNASHTDPEQGRDSRQERAPQKSAPAVPNPVALPGGEELVAKLRPMMRRNRRGPGVSGSVSFLSRGLDQSDAELVAALAAVGFSIPERPNDKPGFLDVGTWTYWLNKDNRGGLWINGRERRGRDGKGRGDASESTGVSAPRDEVAVAVDSSGATMAAEASTAPLAAESLPAASNSEASPATGPTESPTVATDAKRIDGDASPKEDAVGPAPADNPPTGEGPLASIRQMLKAKPRSTTATGEVGELALALNTTPAGILAMLADQGITAPAEGARKADSIELNGESIWISRNDKDGSLWLNAKVEKPARKPRAAGGGPRRSRKAPGKTGEDASA